MEMKPHTIPAASIKLGERFRKDYGDLEDLAESIKTHGLLQPVGINVNRELCFGGRRFRAMTEILGWESVPVILADDSGSELTLRMIELEENVKRLDMTWKERVMSIAEIHRLHSKDAAREGDRWTQEHTGQLLGVSSGNVSYALLVSRHLKNEDSPLHKCDSLTEALRVLIKEREEAATRKAVAISMTKPEDPKKLTEELNRLIDGPDEPPTVIVQHTDSERCVACEGSGVDSKGKVCPICRGTGGGQSASGETITIPLSAMLHRADCLDWLANKQGCFDHIITDPPYAIDMENLAQDDGNTAFANLETAVNEHIVEENLDLIRRFIPLAHECLKNRGFLVMWCDAMHFRWMHDYAIEHGFRAQRWPLTWVKLHRCINRAPGSNFTKTTEFALVLAKGSGTTLAHPQVQSHYLSDRASAKRFGHPFAKPTEVWQWIMEAVALPGQTILDPFAGSGSCIFAAAKAGYKPVGIELVEEHFNQMVTTLQQAYVDWMAPKKVLFK